MADNESPQRDYAPLRIRLSFLVVYGAGLYLVGVLASGAPIPTDGGAWLWWWCAITMYVISMLSAPFFVRPRDTLASALASAPMLFTLNLTSVPQFQRELGLFRWISFGLVVATGALAAIAIALHASGPIDTPLRRRLSRLSYQLAVALGNEAVVFTPPAVISIIGFYQSHPMPMLWLVTVWVVIVSIKPHQLLIQVWGALHRAPGLKDAGELVGRVIRVDDPNLIRVLLISALSWKPNRLHTARLAGDRQVDVVPLFLQTQDDQIVGTGLCADGKSRGSHAPAEVRTALVNEETNKVIQHLAGGGGPVELMGFVVENSNISVVRFEVVNAERLSEGAIVFVRDRNVTIYYQVLDAMTTEEVFTQNPRGTQVVVAGQLGILDTTRGFRQHGWVPPMNAPVFLPTGIAPTQPERPIDADEFVLGTIAQTGMTVKASLREMMTFHTAILGVTGMGKTELVLDMVRAHVAAGRKVFCVDCTGEYEPRLNDLGPTRLNFDEAAVSELDELVNATEHGTYGAPAEKEALHRWVQDNRPQVDANVAAFLEAEGAAVGVFGLPDIANTRASLRATEMYLSSIFAWARAHRRAREILIVLEEAHTVVPETNFFKYDKADTEAVVGRMSQIALQGRKFGVGLLLVSQRTALVSKTLLSQCNTCICFAMYDKTGLEYLASVFASDHVRAIPNLRFLQGLAFGKAIRSDKPVIFEIDEDPTKRTASEALNRPLDLPLPEALRDDRPGLTDDEIPA